jgi:hypothetical protein
MVDYTNRISLYIKSCLVRVPLTVEREGVCLVRLVHRHGSSAGIILYAGDLTVAHEMVPVKHLSIDQRSGRERVFLVCGWTLVKWMRVRREDGALM